VAGAVIRIRGRSSSLIPSKVEMRFQTASGVADRIDSC
jgi:hypothetical protein